MPGVRRALRRSISLEMSADDKDSFLDELAKNQSETGSEAKRLRLGRVPKVAPQRTAQNLNKLRTAALLTGKLGVALEKGRESAQKNESEPAPEAEQVDDDTFLDNVRARMEVLGQKAPADKKENSSECLVCAHEGARGATGHKAT